MSAPLILIDLPIHSRWMRHIFTGIASYAKQHTQWTFTFSPSDSSLGNLFTSHHPPAGVIGRKPTSRTTSLPGVWIEHRHPPWVGMDAEAIGQMACEHLLERGYRHLAVFNTGDYSRTERHLRVNGFITRATEASIPVSVFDVGPRTLRRGTWKLEDQIADLIDFLKELPKPLGLMGCDADHSLRALIACREGGLQVPGDVALVSTADDDLVFAHIQPGISAVVHDQERIGFEAAKLLHSIMEGQDHPQEIRVAPVMIAARGSTDWSAVGDPFCAQVLEHIRSHLNEALKVGDLARTFHVSESTLIRRFKSRLGKTPIQEIAHARIEAAKTMLLTTETPLVDIAFTCGFSGQPHFQREFKKITGMTPGHMRSAHGIG